MIMTYTREQLINALSNEYSYLCHDDYDPDVDMTAAEFVNYLHTLSDSELINEADTDDVDEFILSYTA